MNQDNRMSKPTTTFKKIILSIVKDRLHVLIVTKNHKTLTQDRL